MDKNDAFHKRLLATFKVEAEEHLKAISSGLLELESLSPADSRAGVIERIFREAHSLKGAARAVSHTEVEAVCQVLESIFAALKRREIDFSSQLFDSLHQAVNGLSELLSPNVFEASEAAGSRTAMLIRLLEDLRSTIAPAEPDECECPVEERALPFRLEPGGIGEEIAGQKLFAASKSEATPTTVRIATTRLDGLLFEAEELVSAKLAAGRQTADLMAAHAGFAGWKKQWEGIYSELRMIRRWLEKPQQNRKRGIDSQLERLLDFLSWNKDFVTSQVNSLAALAAVARQGQHSLSIMVDHLLEDMKTALMLPFSSILDVFPKLVRDLARDQGKEAALVIRQGEIEIDRRILEEIKDALIHLVRNCVDHGIEKPEERVRKQKPRRGTITITVSPRDGGKVEIKIADDGIGIDTGKILQAALRAGIVSSEQAATMTEREKQMLIFESGLSTSAIITDISGRGLGLAIVREKAESLGGFVSLEAHPDIGTVFNVVVPMTNVTFRGILLQVEQELFVAPATNVERVLRVDKAAIQTVGNRETIQLDGQTISLVHLADVLELGRKSTSGAPVERAKLVVLCSGEKSIAFLVDEVLNEQEVLVKRLGRQLSRVRNIAGATVLGTGRVVPILNVQDLMKSAVNIVAGARIVASVAAAEVEQKAILVVEDSITARMLLKNILEAAGYRVKTAVDGLDALSLLRTEPIDLVVSDVDMPRMNGFDLTAGIRSDKKLAEMPVVLVTALGSGEDREHGIDVGANGYIVKSSFDQSNLLKVIKRLI